MKILHTDDNDLINMQYFTRAFTDELLGENAEPYLITLCFGEDEYEFRYKTKKNREDVIKRLSEFFSDNNWRVFDIKQPHMY